VEVRIRVEASGINFADLLARMGLYPDAPKLPCVVGYEVAGTIDALGEGVTEFHVGQDVPSPTQYVSEQCYSSRLHAPKGD
jgi:NADPH:quinone reductase-like Zn-dependent oxidoreductase